MTGFGEGRSSFDDSEVVVETRSVNHRFREIKARLPRELAALEPRVSALVADHVERGMVEIVVRHKDRKRAAWGVRVDPRLAEQAIEALRDLSERHGLTGGVSISDLVGIQGLIEVEESPPDMEGFAAAVLAALDQALAGLVRMREQEGQALASDLRARLSEISASTEAIAKEAAGMTAVHRDRLDSRLAALCEEAALDPGRLEAEVALLADRSDVSEEITRLRSHMEQLGSLVDRADGPVGRRMGFLLQELNREITTVGSKSQSLPISKLVVEVKAELERLREQVQNIE